MVNSGGLVCFDLGGVLVRICRSWEEGCAAAGVELKRAWSPADSGGEHHRLVLAYSTGKLDTSEFFRRLEALSGGVYSAHEFHLIHDAWILGEYEGVCDLLGELCESGRCLACLSNTNAAHWELMQQWPSLRHLRHAHASHLIGHAKPDREIYEWFARERAVAPHEIVFFDDLLENIVTAAHLGWDAVQIDHTGDTAAQIRHALRERGQLD